MRLKLQGEIVATLRSPFNIMVYGRLDSSILFSSLSGDYTGGKSSSGGFLSFYRVLLPHVDGSSFGKALGVLAGNDGWICEENVSPTIEHQAVAVSVVMATLIES